MKINFNQLALAVLSIAALTKPVARAEEATNRPDDCYAYWVCDPCSPAGVMYCYEYDSCTNSPTGNGHYQACTPPDFPRPPVIPPPPPHF